jgi:hypothetical protein
VNNQRIDRIRFVTRHFNELQGLRAKVPCGLILMSLGWTDFFSGVPLAITILNLLVILVTVVVILSVGPYYRRAFGEAKQQPWLTDAMRNAVIPILLGCALILVLRAFLPTATLTIDHHGGYFVDLSHKPILPHSWPEQRSFFGQAMCALFGSCFLGIWLRRERRLSQSYYLAFGALLLELAVLGAILALVLPAFSHTPRILYVCLVALWHLEAVALMLCGGTFFLCGVLDHLQIVRSLRPALPAVRSGGTVMNAQIIDRIRFVTRHFNELQGLRILVPLGLIALNAGFIGRFHVLFGPLLRVHFGPLLTPLLTLVLVLVVPGVVLGAFLLIVFSPFYYRKSFGEVERTPVDPSGQLAPLSIFSPAGPAPWLAVDRPLGHPRARRLLITLSLAFALFVLVRAVCPPIYMFVFENEIHQPWMTLTPFLAQTLSVLYGSLFLGTWLWRGRRWSQSYYLALAILPLALAALGASGSSPLGLLVLHGLGKKLWFLQLALADPWMALLLCGASMLLAGVLDHWQLVRTLGWPMAPRVEAFR